MWGSDLDVVDEVGVLVGLEPLDDTLNTAVTATDALGVRTIEDYVTQTFLCFYHHWSRKKRRKLNNLGERVKVIL